MSGSHRRAVTTAFFVNGATFSSWLPRVPEVREDLGLGLDQLGLVLLCGGLGGLVASVGAGRLVDRIGSRRASVVAAVLLSIGLPAIGLASSGVALGAALLVLGAVDVTADIGMNVQAAMAQRRAGRSVNQRFHGAWSIGTLVGGATAAGAAALGIDLAVHLALVGLVLVVATLATASDLVEGDDPPEPAATGARRSTLLVLLAALASAVAVVEGAPGEWGAVFAADVHGASPGVAGLALPAVSAGMVLGRLFGDRATDRLGGHGLFRVAIATSAIGVAVVATSPGVAVALVGFTLCGLGASVLFPAIYLAAAGTAGVPAGLGIGVMSVGARIGFLASPVLVGGVADATSLRASIGGVLLVAAVLAVASETGFNRAGQ